MALPEPAAVLKKIGKAIQKNHRFAFCSAFIMGVITHMFIFTNYLLNSDTTWRLYSTTNVVDQGRWFMQWAAWPSSYVMVPWVIGLLSTLYLALTAMALTELFGLQNKPGIFLVSAVLVTFPAVASSFSYVTTADGIMMSLLLATLAVLVTHKWKWGFIGGGILLAFSLGIYQTYMAFAILLVLFLLVCLALDASCTLKLFLGKLWRFAAMGALGTAVYWVIQHVLLAITGTEMSSYQNLNVLAGSPLDMLRGVFANIAKCYKTFFGALLQWPGFTGLLRLLVLVLYFSAVAVSLVWFIVKTKAYRSPWRLATIVLALVLTPLGANVTLLLGAGSMHMLMMQPHCLFFMLLAIGMDKLTSKSFFPTLMKWAALLLTFAVSFQFFLTTNTAYTNMYLRQQKMYSISLRVLDRMEQTENYEPGMPVVFVGALQNNPAYPADSVLDPLLENMTGTNTNFFLDRSVIFRFFLRDFHNYPYAKVTPQQLEQLGKNPLLEEMEPYPAASSVQVIGGVVVVKLAEEDSVT